MADKEEKLTTEQVASVLGLHRDTVRGLIRSGKLQGKLLYDNPKLGYRVTRHDLAHYLRTVGEPRLAEDVEAGRSPDLAAVN